MSNTKKRFSAWNILWIVPPALVLALFVVMYVIPAFETVNGSADGSAYWMNTLPDDKPLSEVALPGTHDSATRFVQLAYFSKCQALSIKDQLEAGFRYLDIRLGDGERLPLMHGFTHCTEGGLPWSKSLLFDSVLNDCTEFLKAHPSETVVLCVKHEHGDASDAEFADAVAKYVEAAPEIWYAGEGMPTVGEARGRIVLLKRFNDEGRLPGLSFNWSDQGGFDDPSKNAEANDNPDLTLFVQDRYEYESEEKWDAFVKGMEETGAPASAVSLSFLSTKGHAKYGHPYSYAAKLNKKLLELDANEISGWVIVDFASAQIAEHIYGGNF